MRPCRGRAEPRQSDSSGGASRGGPMSPLPARGAPNRPFLSSSMAGAALNLLPIVQESAESAAPLSGTKPGALRRIEPGGDGPSASTGAALAGRLERQSLGPSDRLGSRSVSSRGGPSKRRREESREPAKSGSGPPRRHGSSNLAESSPPAPKARSFAGGNVRRR